MAQKAIQAGNTIITFDDVTHTATPQYGNGNIDLIIKKAVFLSALSTTTQLSTGMYRQHWQTSLLKDSTQLLH